MKLIELTYWRISRMDIVTTAIEKFSKISSRRLFCSGNWGLITCFFLTENSKLATSETPNITFVVRAVNKKK